MASLTDPFAQSVDDSVPSAGSTLPFDDDSYLGDDPGVSSQRFDSFTATHFADSDSIKDPIFHDDNINDNSFSAADDVFMSQPLPEIYSEANGKGLGGAFGGPDNPISPPPAEMEPEEGFALREWRRQNAIRLEEKERNEKEVLNQIIDEADEYKVDFHMRRKITCENNKATNKEKEKLFLANQEKFHAETVIGILLE
ncbi:Clathrin light chain 2 [Morella rubra]|uniref:Clathrin light chain n=1 Tax=Morella rubra TaxID=262757 RepID=A0A6A1VV15_9ROSI|nr:Clathrin light chain 2 [Morella rubra]